ncbi:unnamed protein product [Prunus armeniaca]
MAWMAATRSRRVKAPSLARCSSLDEAFCLDSESPWAGPSWEAMVLLLVFLHGGMSEDSGLIPNRVVNLCRGFFLPEAINGLGCRKEQMNEVIPSVSKFKDQAPKCFETTEKP